MKLFVMNILAIVGLIVVLFLSRTYIDDYLSRDERAGLPVQVEAVISGDKLGDSGFNDLTLDATQLQHMKAYQAGHLDFQMKYTERSSAIWGTKQVLESRTKNCAFLPFQMEDEHYRVNGFTGVQSDEVTQRSEQNKQANSSGPDLSDLKTLKDQIEIHGTPINVRQARYTLPVAVIYNPTSGKKKDIRELVSKKLTAENIEVKFYETARFMHAWELAETEINFAEHSALIAVGGDGTLHEVINGMLMRQDQLSLPISFVPNGSGNDLVGSIGVKDVEQALDWFIKGDIIKMDLNKMLIDVDHEDEIPAEEKQQKLRYSATSASLGFIAKAVHDAVDHKPYTGNMAYITAGITAFGSTYEDSYDISIEQADGQVQTITNIQSMVVMVMNGIYAGGRIPFCPGAYLNDGLFDFLIMTKPKHPGMFDLLRTIKDIIGLDGWHLHSGFFDYFRGKKIVFQNKSMDPASGQKVPQLLQVDGEAFQFIDKVSVEVIPNAVDLIVNYQELMTGNKLVGSYEAKN